MTHCDVAYQAAGSGNHHVGTQLKAFRFLVVAAAVVAAIDGHTADTFEIVAKTFHRLVDLLGQLAGGTHDDAVDGVFGVIAVVDETQNGEQVGGCLACSRLGYPYKVATVENLWDALLLNGGAGLETHVVKRIEYVVV